MDKCESCGEPITHPDLTETLCTECYLESLDPDSAEYGLILGATDAVEEEGIQWCVNCAVCGFEFTIEGVFEEFDTYPMTTCPKCHAELELDWESRDAETNEFVPEVIGPWKKSPQG